MAETLKKIALQEFEKTMELCEIIENAWSDEKFTKDEIQKFLDDNN